MSADAAELLSALADGQCCAAETLQAVNKWAAEPKARESWQTWHVIGDVLRSEDLAPSRAEGAAFLDRLHAQLAVEPAPLAPAAWRDAAEARASRPGVSRALGATLMGAGVAAAVLTVWMVLPAGTGSQGLEGSPPGLAAVAPAAPSASLSPPGSALQPGSGQFIRDARLDEQLRTQPAGGATPPGGGAKGRLETAVLERR